MSEARYRGSIELLQPFLFRRIEAIDAKKRQIRFANERRLAPKADQFGGSAPGQVRYHHSVERTRRRCCGRIQIGIPVHVNHPDIAEIPADPRNRARATEQSPPRINGQRAGFYGLLDSRFERFEGLDDGRQISGARDFLRRACKCGWDRRQDQRLRSQST